ncbi:hypothetical protein LCGC14_2239270 [marine sediment metagenome]|uniref:DUF1353 domain-containing protein n=1 Tax=marine sediment metagenome TaxID=412755 RepID=A0A0F9D637_9ZZZZ
MKKRIRNSFLTPLLVEVMPSGKRFKLLYPFTYYWRRYGIKVSVPAGFVTSKLGRYNKAAVLHDRAYQKQMVIVAGWSVWQITRQQADLLFLDAMIDLGVVKWKRTVMFGFVRMWGWLSWRK